MQLERQKKILDYLNKNRKATTKELSQLLDVSTTTIRTDLNQMDRENLITKTHGGAVYNDRSLDNISLMKGLWRIKRKKKQSQIKR